MFYVAIIWEENSFVYNATFATAVSSTLGVEAMVPDTIK